MLVLLRLGRFLNRLEEPVQDIFLPYQTYIMCMLLSVDQDLHRTGCSGFSGQDNEEDRAILKRVLLAYARWNKRVGYCQGFNVIAALLLEVMECQEDEALKVCVTYRYQHFIK